ncbi:MAG: pyridoxine 5'-phosphate synthase [Candidatus Omnitrophica bacterium]|nr:pyridoxine 5'-phosphate synthase [Candidatus Omnitrophota bacterium]
MPRLGVNIDHVATLREARHGIEPEPLFAALICEASGADSIVAHLREDSRHIKEGDVFLLRKAVRTMFNLEMSCAEQIVAVACKVKPDRSTLVPERRQELTTEGGLDVAGNLSRIKKVVDRLSRQGIAVSLFIDPEKKQIDAAVKSGVKMIELHTGRYADSSTQKEENRFLAQIVNAASYAKKKKLRVFAGHGLNYYNVSRISRIKEIEELNIGYSIICRAVIVGLSKAVSEMKELIK